MEERQKSDERELAEAIYKTFKSAEGKVVLAYMMNEAGYFSTDPGKINADNVALINRLLIAGHMTVAGDMGKYALAVVESYDASDLIY